ncbi:GH43 family beta-xylosidase [Paenibacillus phyllosphaerae]|uniref:GH43 family beta-xylosidase n=1 Tax=Paenibacillus phyllosphaerae TaxID=274593 RepID=A0A7W5AUG4_9BACL|nr:GH43 family beta-xylosidase [Paenibacillus phyllosphaerae]
MFDKVKRLGIRGSALLLLLMLVIPHGSAFAATHQSNFYNVLVQDGADPWVYRHTDGNYYFTKTTGGNVTIWKSASLTGIDAGTSRVIETGCCGIWAPEIHYINGAWYIYYAKDNGDNVNHRMYVLENTSADPMQGTWVNKGQITDPTNKWAIDGTVLQTGGQLYFIWSGWEGDTNVRQNLYIAHMRNPWTIDSARTEIARPVHAWETNHSPNVNEGPQVIVRGGVISLVYSASGSWTNDYCLGLITASASSNLLNASSWTKRSQPIFQSANSLYGPGHHSFTTSPDGTENWIVYHVAKYNNAGWNREIRAQRFTWNSDNTPNLGSPAPANTPISIPSGESQRVRYEGEEGTFGGGAYASASTTASGGSKAGHIDTASSYVDYSVYAAAAGEYILSARTANGTAGGGWSTLTLAINGVSSPLHVTNKGWENWGTSTRRTTLNAGWNTVRFSKGEGYAELDFFDLTPAAPAALTGSVYKLINPISGKALDVAGGGTADGTNVQLYQDNNSTAQEWRITSLGDGAYTLVNTNSGKALDVDGSGTANGTNVHIWQNYNGTPAQRFAIVPSGSAFKLINPNSGKALDIAGGSTANGANVQIYQDLGNDAQRWTLVRK